MLTVSNEPGGRIDLGTISDPGGRRRVRIRIGGRDLIRDADPRLLGEYFVVCQQQHDRARNEDGDSEFALLPGVYRIGLFGDPRPGWELSLGTGFQVPPGEGVFVVDFPKLP